MTTPKGDGLFSATDARRGRDLINENAQGKPSGAQEGTKLIITSHVVHVSLEGELSMRCASCQRILPFRAFGVRNMGGGELRSQPQCKACR